MSVAGGGRRAGERALRPRLLVLLGAGASSGYAPSTDELTQRLLGLQWGSARREPFREAYDLLKVHFREPPAINFELLIGAIELLASHRQGSEIFGDWTIRREGEAPRRIPRPWKRSLLRPFIRWKRTLAGLRDGFDLALLADEACRFILDETSAHCRQRSTNVPLVDGLRRLAARATLRCMSLNYGADLDHVAAVPLASFVPCPACLCSGGACADCGGHVLHEAAFDIGADWAEDVARKLRRKSEPCTWEPWPEFEESIKVQSIARRKVARLDASPAVLEGLAIIFAAIAARARFEIVRERASADRHQDIRQFLRRAPKRAK